VQLPPIPIPDTLRGVDDLIRADFEAYRDFWFHQLLLATLLVVVGLVLEGPELWYEITSIIRQWRSMRKFSTPRETSSKLGEIIGIYRMGVNCRRGGGRICSGQLSF
jgi:hypothetical protein